MRATLVAVLLAATLSCATHLPPARYGHVVDVVPTICSDGEPCLRVTFLFESEGLHEKVTTTVPAFSREGLAYSQGACVVITSEIRRVPCP